MKEKKIEHNINIHIYSTRYIIDKKKKEREGNIEIKTNNLLIKKER